MAVKIGCVIMAAGNSTRYGSNKLLEKIDGKAMFERIADAVPSREFFKIVTVTQYDEISRLAQSRGFQVTLNPQAERGLSSTVKLGLAELMDADGVMFCVSDQPFLTSSTIAALCALFKKEPLKIALPVSEGRRGNPCIFPKALFSELMELEGDMGGRSVIEKHEDRLSFLEVFEKELRDIDMPE